MARAPAVFTAPGDLALRLPQVAWRKHSVRVELAALHMGGYSVPARGVLSAPLRMQPPGEPIGSDRAARAVVQQEKVHFFLEHSINKLFI